MKKFTNEELIQYRRLGLEAIIRKLATGFNFYLHSIEKEFADSVHIPIKYSHRQNEFVLLLEQAVKNEFKDRVLSKKIPRKTIHRWLKGYAFPRSEEKINIFDTVCNHYIKNEKEYAKASKRLIAEADEYSLLFIPIRCAIKDLANFIVAKGSFFLVDAEGNLILSKEGDSRYPFAINPERISDKAYMTPMIITSYREELANELSGFSPVKKLYTIKGHQEISVYLDKTYEDFKSFCKINFEGPVLRLANKLFKDFINFEEDPRLISIF